MRGDATAARALDRMCRAAVRDGVGSIQIVSAYRGYEKQRILFDQRVEELREQFPSYPQEQLEAEANRTVSRPGESEHHTGLAFDLQAGDVAMEQFGSTEQGRWIEAHCAEYGFVLRYPHDKVAYTGIDNEPWHVRYVGTAAAQTLSLIHILYRVVLMPDASAAISSSRIAITARPWRERMNVRMTKIVSTASANTQVNVV